MHEHCLFQMYTFASPEGDTAARKTVRRQQTWKRVSSEAECMAMSERSVGCRNSSEAAAQLLQALWMWPIQSCTSRSSACRDWLRFWKLRHIWRPFAVFCMPRCKHLTLYLLEQLIWQNACRQPVLECSQSRCKVKRQGTKGRYEISLYAGIKNGISKLRKRCTSATARMSSRSCLCWSKVPPDLLFKGPTKESFTHEVRTSSFTVIKKIHSCAWRLWKQSSPESQLSLSVHAQPAGCAIFASNQDNQLIRLRHWMSYQDRSARHS